MARGRGLRHRLTAPARWSVAGQTFALQVLVAVLVVGVGPLGAYAQAQRAGTQEATARATAVAETVASTPDVVDAVQDGDPAAVLQPFAEDVRAETGTDFVVIMSPTGIRYTHPDPAQIGGQFLGHIAAARAGGTVVEDYTGTLGPSRRVVVPVRRRRPGGRAGRRRDPQGGGGERLRGQLPGLLLAGLAAALLSGLGTALVARRIRRQTHGLGERQLREMVEYYDAVLHAVTEGLLLTDLDGRLRLANDEAVRLLGLPDDARGRPVAELGLAAPLVAALTDDEPREDELHVTAARVLVLNKAPAQWDGHRWGSSPRCATAPTSSTSPASSTRPAASPRRCARRPTSRPTGCTPSSRSSSSVTPTARWPSPPRSSRVAAAHRPRRGLGGGAGADRPAAGQGGPGRRARHRLRGRRERALAPGRRAGARRRDHRRATSSTTPSTPWRRRWATGGCASTPGSRAATPCWSWRTPGRGCPRTPSTGVPARVLHQGARGAGRRGIGLALVAQSVARLGGSWWRVRRAPGSPCACRLGGKP